jgi:hypothetical protein
VNPNFSEFFSFLNLYRSWQLIAKKKYRKMEIARIDLSLQTFFHFQNLEILSRFFFRQCNAQLRAQNFHFKMLRTFVPHKRTAQYFSGVYLLSYRGGIYNL